MHDPKQPEFKFSAAGATKTIAVVTGDSLTFTGIVIGRIKVLSARYRFFENDDVQHLYEIWESVATELGTSPTDHEKFIWTLLCEKIKKIQFTGRTQTHFLLGILGYLGLRARNSGWTISMSASLFDYWGDFASTGRNDRLLIGTWVGTIGRVMMDRRFFFGFSKIMGLANEGVREGDLICIPLGPRHPQKSGRSLYQPW